jgi:3-deoxy-D-manno-octulosonic-acid transferase
VEELAGALIGLLTDTAAAEAMGARARQVFDAQAGATARSLEAIKELLAAPVDVEVSK